MSIILASIITSLITCLICMKWHMRNLDKFVDEFFEKEEQNYKYFADDLVKSVKRLYE